MYLIDTHCHLFLPEFNDDRDAMIQRALSNRIEGFVLPNVDSGTTQALKTLSREYPNLMYPLMGLHPTSVEDDYLKELDLVYQELSTGQYFGIGEIGIDLYWDTSFKSEQEEAFRKQLVWAQESDLPVVIHIRNSFAETIRVIESVPGPHRGIFHCFTGSLDEAHQAIALGFHLGIGGVVTFKNSKLDEVVAQIDPKHLVIETDSPYLAPHPKRGKRNESAFLAYTTKKLADIFSLHTDQIAGITTSNAQRIFGISSSE